MKLTLKNNMNNECNMNRNKKIIIDRLYKNNMNKGNKCNINPQQKYKMNEDRKQKQKIRTVYNENENIYKYRYNDSTTNSSYVHIDNNNNVRVSQFNMEDVNVGNCNVEIQDNYGLNRKKSYKYLQVINKNNNDHKQQIQQSMLLSQYNSHRISQQSQSFNGINRQVYTNNGYQQYGYTQSQSYFNQFNINNTIKYRGVPVPQNRTKTFRNLLKQLYNIAQHNRQHNRQSNRQGNRWVNRQSNRQSNRQGIQVSNGSSSLVSSSMGSSILDSSNPSTINKYTQIHNNNNTLKQTAYFVQPLHNNNNNNNNNDSTTSNRYNNNNNNNNNNISNSNSNINSNMINNNNNSNNCLRRVYRPSPVQISIQSNAQQPAYSLTRRIQTQYTLGNDKHSLQQFRQKIHTHRYLRPSRSHTERSTTNTQPYPRNVGVIRRQNSQADLYHNHNHNSNNGCGDSSEEKLKIIRQQLHNIYNNRNNSNNIYNNRDNNNNNNSNSNSNLYQYNKHKNNANINSMNNLHTIHTSNNSNMQQYYNRAYLMQHKNNNNNNNNSQNRYKLLINRDKI